MPKLLDLTNKRFGQLLVIKHAGKGKNGHHQWNCLCDCGSNCTVLGINLKARATKSCGCARIELSRQRRLTHGKSGTPEHRAWIAIHKRCYDKKDKSYHRYGGRGIVVCKRWHRFENFYYDMRPKPSAKHSIERLNNNGLYSPKNCVWALPEQQANNRRSNRQFQFKGKRMTLRQILNETGVVIKYGTVMARIRDLGWGLREALYTPV